jgi:hypothetical protein
MADEALTLNRTAAARIDPQACAYRTTRSRKSREQAFGMAGLHQTAHDSTFSADLGIPKSQIPIQARIKSL